MQSYANNQTTVSGVGGGVMNLLDLDMDDVASGPLGEINMDYGEESQTPVQSQPVSSNNPLGDFDLFGAKNSNQSSSSVLFSQLSLEQKLVLPKQVLLTAQSSKGFEVHGTFARRGGNILLEMTLFNRAMQPMSDIAMQFNKNRFVFSLFFFFSLFLFFVVVVV